jgi:3-hydroxyisobutyryl-CoA hydrolase
MGKYNKPLLINLNGSVLNSGASIFTRVPLCMGSPHTKFKLNETELGYIPDAGSSYYLSRLPRDFGTFLALTGFEIDGFDVSRAGIAYERMFFSKENLERNFKRTHLEHD